MSWIEKEKNGIEITTGDGKKYTPLYIIASKTVEYNIAEFEFPNIAGTLVKKSQPKGARYTFDLFFQGENHLDESKDFEISNRDTRPWKVYHPFYGNLVLQVSSLKFDPSGLNVTKITGELIETITDELPLITIDPKNKTSFDYQNVNDALSESFGANVIANPADTVLMTNNNEKLYSLGAESVKSGDQSNEYFQLFNTANTAALNAANNASVSAQLIIDLYTYPSLFVDDVKNRLKLLLRQFESISDALDNFTTFNEKSIYEMSSGAIVSAMVNSAINPTDTDYENTNDVLDTINQILTVYNQFIVNLDFLQTPTGDDTNSYIPNQDSLLGLSDLVNYGVANLFDIALDAKQERIIYLESDSNVIVLAHRFYGLDEEDLNISKFMNQNNIIIATDVMKKGREIFYYV